MQVDEKDEIGDESKIEEVQNEVKKLVVSFEPEINSRNNQ